MKYSESSFVDSLLKIWKILACSSTDSEITDDVG